ncbi:MAG: hypothetical protein ABI186_09160 [Candidatus Elarobacter sp.]
MRSTILSLAAVAVVLLGGAATAPAPVGAASEGGTTPAVATNPCPHGAAAPAALRLPRTLPPGDPVAFERRILGYLNGFEYRHLGWCVDKAVRDTGPYVHGVYYGTHPAVRIYYSPEMIAWLRGGRHGVPRDGAVMIKEQYSPTPAARYDGLGDDALRPDDWTIMIRKSSASHDGWFWAEVWTSMFAAPPLRAKTAYPNAGFGIYCLRCHASADHALTFSATENIKGFPGEPLTYRTDDSWRMPPPRDSAPAAVTAAPNTVHEKNATLPAAAHVARSEVHDVPRAVQTFPAEPLDTFLAPHGRVPQFVTSDQCMGCHSASSGPPAQPFGPAMWYGPGTFAPPTPAPAPRAPAVGVNVSPYGEWRWSPMGLAGRDPVFYAQLESEQRYVDTIPAHAIEGGAARAPRTRSVLKQQIVDTCMQCHGAMGKRTFALDHPRGGATFSAAFVFDGDPTNKDFHYGGLARDGISCTICHRAIQTPQEKKSLAFLLNHRINGTFAVGRPDRIGGPFTDATIAVHPMDQALGMKPVFSPLMQSARLCASCHTINLAVIDKPAIHPINALDAHDVEQNTYVEWINSRYQTEYKPGPHGRTCQDCHMPVSVENERLKIDVPQIQTRIALVQDQTYPQSAFRAPLDGIDVRWRKRGFHRHELLGLNAFLLATFKQNPDVLGVRLADYMSGSASDLDDAYDNVVRQAARMTASLDLTAQVENGTLTTDVGVTNLTGHRFPSGVGFRRAFVELRVLGSGETTLFVSGATSPDPRDHGAIVGADGRPLPSESFARDAQGRQQFQDHFDERHPIVDAGHVQIFEDLVRDHEGNFTTSFLRRDHSVKDNRLLPKGWRRHVDPALGLPEYFLRATYPHGARVETDPHYGDGAGRAVVRYRIPLRTAVDPSQLRVVATLWYQSWAPYFIAERTRGNGSAATRLRSLVDGLQLDGTPLAGWKLRIASRTVSPRP